MLDFKEIRIDDKERFDSILNAIDANGGLYPTADYTFGNLFIWKHRYDTRVAFDWDACFIMEKGGEYAYFPICSNEELAEALKKQGCRKLMYVTDDMLARLDACGIVYEKSELPHSFDYVYLYGDLAELPGKKYHQKRNHIAYFEKLYPDHRFEMITPDNIDECRDFSIEWGEQSLHGIDDEERIALDMSLENFFRLGFEGGLIRVGGEVVAMSAGERRGDSFVVHIEKALNTRGAYPVINRDFVRNVCVGSYLINREEDMGIEGLAKAKQSYHPTFMLKKYSVTICV